MKKRTINLYSLAISGMLSFSALTSMPVLAAPEDELTNETEDSTAVEGTEEQGEESAAEVTTSVKGVTAKYNGSDYYYYYTASDTPYTGLLGVYGMKTAELIREGEQLTGPNAKYVTWLKHVQQYVKDNEVTDNELRNYLSDGFTFSDSNYWYDKTKPAIIGVLAAVPDEQWIYVTNGYFDDHKNGFVDYDGSKFFVVKGELDKLGANGLVNDIDHTQDWYFCAAGQAQTSYTGLALYDEEWFYVNKGKLDTKLSAYVEYDNGLFYVGAGRIMTEVSGLAQDPKGSDWYFLANGQAQIQYTGLALYDGEWFYVINGKLAVDYTGTVDYHGASFDVVNGMVQ